MCGKMQEKSVKDGVLATPFFQLFQIHGSIFKPHPACNPGQTSMVCISHGVFFFCIGKNTLNGLFAHCAVFFPRSVRRNCSTKSTYSCQIWVCSILWPFSLAPHMAINGQLLQNFVLLRYVRLPSLSVVVCLRIPLAWYFVVH